MKNLVGIRGVFEVLPSLEEDPSIHFELQSMIVQKPKCTVHPDIAVLSNASVVHSDIPLRVRHQTSQPHPNQFLIVLSSLFL